MGQNAAGKMAEVVAPLLGRGGGGREGRRCGDEGEMKGLGRRFGSTPTGCGRAMDGGARSGGKPGSNGSVRGGR
jgi:hypothetical protein